MSNDNYGDGNSNSGDDNEYGAFLNRMHELRLMVRDLILNPAPISEQLNIRKLKVLNYALGEWTDEYERIQHNTSLVDSNVN
jgi:hypothetical protein